MIDRGRSDLRVLLALGRITPLFCPGSVEEEAASYKQSSSKLREQS